MLGGGADWNALLVALEEADRHLTIEAAASVLVTEAAVVRDKGWSAAEITRWLSPGGLYRGWPRAALEAALTVPADVVPRLRSAGDEWGGIVVGVLGLVALLRRLPTLPPRCAPPPDEGEQARVHGKVRALLAKAESTPFPAEAEACTAKAQELMARYSIDEATVGAAAPSGSVLSIRVGIDRPYARPKFVLLSTIARSNRCRSVWLDAYGFATVFGMSSDLWAVDLLYTSLLVQAGVALQQEEDRSRSFRHAFLLGFAHRIGGRLREATASATSVAEAASAVSLLPVLAAREDAALAARDAAFPDLGRPMQVSASNGWGTVAGHRAADAASLGKESSLTGPPRRLGP
jgi:hypothetical protein